MKFEVLLFEVQPCDNAMRRKRRHDTITEVSGVASLLLNFSMRSINVMLNRGSMSATSSTCVLEVGRKSAVGELQHGQRAESKLGELRGETFDGGPKGLESLLGFVHL